MVYLLELSTLLATRDVETVESTGKQVFDSLQSILRDPNQWHATTISRTTFYALKMMKASYVSEVIYGIKSFFR